MKLVSTFVLAAALFLSQIMFSQEKVTITAEVENVSSNEGKVGFALYNKTTFMKEPIKAINGTIENNKSIVIFKDIEPGDYAIICYHDKNNNDKNENERNDNGNNEDSDDEDSDDIQKKKKKELW